jgi:outer membrane protein OmpA-like peptidoglycan-associated protein
MKYVPLHASLMSLALFALAGPALAQAPDAEPGFTLAQAETEAPAADFEQIRKFLAGGRDPSRLDDDRLQQRLSRAKRFLETEGLPPELAQELEQEIAQVNAEIERRQQAAQEQPPAAEPEQPQAQVEEPPPPQPEAQPEVQSQAQPEVQPEPQPETQQQVQEQTQEQAAPQGSDEVALFLQSVRPASELGEDELRRQMRQAMALADSEGLSKDQRRALRDVIREARAELRNKGGSNEAAETPAPLETPPETQPEVQQAQPEAQPQQPVAEQPPAAEQQPQAKVAEVDPALEAQARALLEETVNVQEMKRRDLRQRLSTMRDLLASEKLSPETADALRQKLAEERQILRNEVSQGEDQTPPAQPQAQQPQQPQQGSGTVTNNVTINNNTTITNTEIQIALNDRRPPEQLDDDELVRRIDIYRDVVRNERYDLEEREAWRRALERDRRYLRRQMLEEREERAARLRRGDFELNIEIYDDYDPGRDYQDDVFAAEVEDEELADVLAAPPRRKVQRRYTVDEFERSSTARDAVARIEIDTVNFGFGEGFLREEEIDKLDRIARVLERILAKNPDEVFLLEGHTDAVGSAGSNLQLSRERASAVKEALTTYYVIPARNLKTVGLGERYLKIPTLEAEAENRRVSLARITALVSRAD